LRLSKTRAANDVTNTIKSEYPDRHPEHAFSRSTAKIKSPLAGGLGQKNEEANSL
jgi:hypothetical protein